LTGGPSFCKQINPLPAFLAHSTAVYCVQFAADQSPVGTTADDTHQALFDPLQFFSHSIRGWADCADFAPFASPPLVEAFLYLHGRTPQLQ
jgi:hypothetical protein